MALHGLTGSSRASTDASLLRLKPEGELARIPYCTAPGHVRRPEQHMFARLGPLRHGLSSSTARPVTGGPSMSIVGRRTVSFQSLYRSLTHPGPPVLARYPRAYEVFHGLKVASAFLLAVHIFTDYFYDIRGTWGISMQPTLAPTGDSVLVSKYYRHGRGVEVGDIISFKHPMREDVRASKRVIGMPGDFVLRDTPDKGKGMMIQVSRSSRSGSLGLEGASDADMRPHQVPQGHCWVVGDNLNHSRDSRMIGPIPLALVRGKVIATFSGWSLWPHPVRGGLDDASDMWAEYKSAAGATSAPLDT
ncbi:hypothetical protein MBLNU459_g3302t2 [Dothideomycetes sp. NU459]